MKNRDISSLKTTCAIVLPVLGWVAAAYVTNVRFTPFLEAFKAAVDSTPRNPALLAGLVLGGLLAFLVSYLADEYGDEGYRGADYRRVLRGTRMANWHELKRRVEMINRKTNRRDKTRVSPVKIGPMPMPIHLENRNLLICGSIGAGKSVSIDSLVASIISRRDKLVATDPDGTLASKFMMPGDIILNPFDHRTAHWKLFNEIRSVHDFDRIAKSVIPPQPSGSDHEEWCGFARDILADTMRKLYEQNTPDTDTLVSLLIREPGEVIRDFLANTDSQGYFRENAERATASVQFLMTTYVRPLRHVTQGDFSLHDWVNDPDAGNIFITTREDMRSTLRPLVSTWIDMICSAILSLQPMSGKRVWMSLDELASLGKLDSFVPAATNGRRFGLRMIAGLQDWAQLDLIYGKDAAKIIQACFRNYLIFASSNAHNATRASEIIGEHEVERLRLSNNFNMRGNGMTRNVVHEREMLIMPSEISNLPDLSGYVLFAEELPLAKIKLPYVPYRQRVPAFELA